MKVYAHRGASDQYPENTMLAFNKAIEYGADGIEADVHLSKDGICVLIHDETIDRTSNAMGWVKDYTYQQLSKFEYKNGKDVPDGINIPTLEQLLQLARDKAMPLILDLKTDCIDYPDIEKKVYALVKEYNLLTTTIFSSNNMETLVNLKNIDKSVITGYIFERRFEDNAIKARHYHIDYLHPRYSMLTDKILQKTKEIGLKLNVWTPNKEDNLKLVNSYDVNICITNRVTVAKSIVNKEKV